MKRFLIVLSLILPSLSALASPPPPPSSANSSPIDAGVLIVLLAGILIGSMYKQLKNHKQLNT